MTEQSTKIKAAATAVAAVTAAGLLVGGSFASSDELLSGEPHALVETLTPPVQSAGEDDGSPELGGEEEKQAKRGVKAAVRRLVLSAPLWARAAVALPLWAVGTGLISLASVLWSALLSPIASTLLSWLLFAGLAVLVYTLAAKTVFPDLPLKKILNKRSLLSIVLACFALGLLDLVLPFFWDDYAKAEKLFRLFGSLLCAVTPLAFFLRRRRREEIETVEAEPVEDTPEQAPPELSPEEKEAASRRLVQELADSVCPRAR